MKHVILVIDDEEGVRELYRMEMEAAGYRVLTAEDSAGAMEVLARERVDLIVLDVRLRGESGLELLQKLQEDRKKIPVIISSAYSSYRSDFSSWLAEGYVVKSTDTSELLAEIERVLRRFYPKGRRKA